MATPALGPTNLIDDRTGLDGFQANTSLTRSAATNYLQDEVANLAYALWQQRGCHCDSPEIDWYAAEDQLHSVPFSGI
jgi:hypothetical protein